MSKVKKIFMIILIVLGSSGYSFSEEYRPEDGDVIFQTSRSTQSLVIQLATKSKYSHVGIIYIKNGQPFVFEAIEPVMFTPLADWVDRGDDGHYVVKRLLKAKEWLTSEARESMLEVSKTFEGRHYDHYFEWSDERIYCSELIWKIYKRGLGLEVGKLKKMSEFDFSDPLVQGKVRERFGDSFPKDEIVISPAAIFASDLLVTVYER
jgi:hypothetical protein